MSSAGRSLVVVAAVVAFSACGGGNDDEAGDDVVVDDTASVTTDAELDDGGTTDPTTSAAPISTEPPPVTEPELVALTGTPIVEGIPAVTLLEPLSDDAGPAPLFRWQPVDGSVRYSLSLLGPSEPVWAWQGEATEIYLGGLTVQPPAGLSGLVLPEQVCWSVVAYGEDGHVIAASPIVAMAPSGAAGHECTPS